MRLLDLFCGAGGAAMGYRRAGFTEIVGIDIRDQPRYPFTFVCADALEYVIQHGQEFDVIHASPPCQAYSAMRHFATSDYPMLVEDVRQALEQIGRPFVIENVPGAPLRDALMLCGTMFGLLTLRHRLFECSPGIYFAPALCRHHRRAQKQGRLPDPDKHFITVTGHYGGADFARRAMGIDWMNRDELAESIPPAYTQFVGQQLLSLIAA